MALTYEYLAPGGAIILDNAEGYGFFDEVSKRDCRRVDFFGFAPGVSLRHCTSIVFVKIALSFPAEDPYSGDRSRVKVEQP